MPETKKDVTEVVNKVLEAIDLIKRGTCKRVDVSDTIKVYEVKNVIRIDVKAQI